MLWNWACSHGKYFIITGVVLWQVFSFDRDFFEILSLELGHIQSIYIDKPVRQLDGMGKLIYLQVLDVDLVSQQDVFNRISHIQCNNDSLIALNIKNWTCDHVVVIALDLGVVSPR